MAPLRYGIDPAKLPDQVLDSMSEPVRRVLSLDNARRSEVTRARVQRAIEAFQEREGDTGSSSVQIAVLTVRIEALREHVEKHPKDHNTKRGLEALFTKRRKLLQYLKRKDFDEYREIARALQLV